MSPETELKLAMGPVVGRVSQNSGSIPEIFRCWCPPRQMRKEGLAAPRSGKGGLSKVSQVVQRNELRAGGHRQPSMCCAKQTWVSCDKACD